MESLVEVSGFWQDKRVLVTGATGLIGAHLSARLLDAGAEVAALVKDADLRSDLYRSRRIERVAVFNGALEDFRALELALSQHEASVVFHLGAQTIVGAARRSPLATFEANIRGTYNLLDACREHRDMVEAVIVASSDKAYGEQQDLPYREEMSLSGRFPYEVSKSCTDLLARSYHESYRLPVAVARCGNVYGGNDLNFSRIIPGTIRSLIKGEPPVIRSDGTYLRDYIYVRDVAGAYCLLAENINSPSVRGEAFNFSSESPCSVLEVVEAIQETMGIRHPAPVVLDSASGEIRNQYLDASKARRVLGWESRYTLEEGLAETVDWYRDYFNVSGEEAG